MHLRGLTFWGSSKNAVPAGLSHPFPVQLADLDTSTATAVSGTLSDSGDTSDIFEEFQYGRQFYVTIGTQRCTVLETQVGAQIRLNRSSDTSIQLEVRKDSSSDWCIFDSGLGDQMYVWTVTSGTDYDYEISQ